LGGQTTCADDGKTKHTNRRRVPSRFFIFMIFALWVLLRDIRTSGICKNFLKE
jgi:hypothetical protein